MIIASIILLSFGLVQGISWWQLPDFYLKSDASTSTLAEAVYYAARFDRRFAPPNITLVVEDCDIFKPENNPQLDVEEMKAIRCYTLNYKISYYINTALQNLDDDLIKAWTPFLKFFHAGVAKQDVANSHMSLCRGDAFFYGDHPLDSVVRIPLSYSMGDTTSEVCKMYAGQSSVVPGANFTCTITKLHMTMTAKYIAPYSSKPYESEFIMLPGTLAEVLFIIPQTPTTCRIVILQEVKRKSVSTSKFREHLFKNYQLAAQIEQYDRFLRGYYMPSFSVSVAKTLLMDINISGGGDDPYNFWPYITNITYGKKGSSSKLGVGQLLMGVNENPTRGLLQTEVDALIQNAKMDQKPYTNFTVAPR